MMRLQCVGDSKRRFCKKFGWIGVYAVLVVCLAVGTRDLYGSWRNQSTILIYDSRKINTWDIPFPAVTICPSTKIKPTDEFHYATQLFCMKQPLHWLCDNPSNDSLTHKMRAASMVCKTKPSFVPTSRSIDDVNIYKTIQEIALKRSDILKLCLQMVETSCETMFHDTMTEEGLCFTFNMLKHTDFWRENIHTDFDHQQHHNLSRHEWIEETGLFSSLADNIMLTYPRRVPGSVSSSLNELLVSLGLNDDFKDTFCDHLPFGYKVLLHAPDEFPVVLQQNFHHIGLNEFVQLIVRPDVLQFSQDLNKFHPQRRKCYLSSEKYLSFFKVYNQRNCEIECLANATLTKCGCVKFYMPRLQDTPICDLDKYECCDNVRHDFYGRSGSTRRYRSRCDCLPKCSSITYNSDARLVTRFELEMTEIRPSALSVAFKYSEFESKLRRSHSINLLT